MAQDNSFALQHAAFDTFLLSNLYTERTGMAVTVLSAISRLNEDPWDQARRLSGMPKAAAIDDLARMIARLPVSPWPPHEAANIAARLVPLLPMSTDVVRPRPDHPEIRALVPHWMRTQPLYTAITARFASLTPGPSSIARSRPADRGSRRSIPLWARLLPLCIWLGIALAMNLVAFHGHSASHSQTTNHAVTQKAQAPNRPFVQRSHSVDFAQTRVL